MHLINVHSFSLIIAVKLLRLGFHQPNLTATCTATIRLQHRGSFESGWEGPGSASQDPKDKVRVTLFHRSPSPVFESQVTFLRNLKVAHMVYLLLLSNVLLQDYMEVNQPWGEKINMALPFWNTVAFLLSTPAAIILTRQHSVH